jgi:pimeloyl-ACP methyl ester carboxylesterase
MDLFFLGNPDPDNRALVLIHGAGGNHALWGLVYRDLRARDIPAVAIDLPGHGRSPGETHSTVAGYVSAVTAACAGLGLDRFVVAGHSLGGAVALALAATGIPGLAGAGVVSAGARLPVDPMILRGTHEAFECTVKNLARFCFARGTPPEILKQAAHTLAEAGPAVLHADFSASAAFCLTDVELAKVRVPVEVICGEFDILTPLALSEELAEKVPDGHLTRLVQCGHMPLIEDPAGLAGALERLWQRAFPPRS